jgi:hypothetical protein
MRIAPPIRLSSEQQEALEQCARARSLSVRLVERARIVLLASRPTITANRVTFGAGTSSRLI